MARRKSVNPHVRLQKKPLKVTVTAVADGNGIKYGHSIMSLRAARKTKTKSKTKKRAALHGDPIKLPKDSGPYEITFELETELNLRFDAAGPFLCDVTYAGACPTSLNRVQFMVDSCTDDELVVVDWNHGEGAEFYFQLNFVNKAGIPQIPYDPIIINGGGIRS
jgi:hypothetical protein